MVKKVTMNLDLLNASCHNYILVVLLKNCESELSHILAELFNECLKESCFPDCWNVSSVVPVFKNVGERSTPKNYRPVSLLSVVSKVFEKLVNNRIVDHLEKRGLFSDFQYGFRSSWSTADLLTVVSVRIARVFNRSQATRAVALNISKAFDRVWLAGLLHKFKSCNLCWWYYSQFLHYLNSYVISIGKTAFKKIGALIHSMKFLSHDVALYLYKSTTRPCMEYCCHIWTGAPSCFLELLDKLQKQICNGCCSFTCCFSWTPGSSSECGQRKSSL